MMKNLWGGRFAENLDGRVLDFTASFSFDVRLLPHDIRGSIAHARMLGATGIIGADEAAKLIGALGEILQETSLSAPDGRGAEDVHSWVENRLREKVGETAGKLHTGRSRNDQVALDMKLFAREAAGAIIDGLERLERTLLDRAAEAVMPGFTHLQPAQPVLLAHHLTAYIEMFRRDRGRFSDARRRCGESPLGAGALAGSSLPLDREAVARELGFDSVTRNSLDSVSDRDFVIEMSAASALVMVHLSRLAEEVVLWATPAFGFVELPDRLATGSSMMPQKKNPDVAELTRGKSGRVFGNLVALLTVMKGLPLAYQRDMQEDKESFFDTVDTLLGCLAAMDLLVSGIVFDTARMAAEARRGHTVATDLAEYLVTRGMPFRQAHEVVGGLVRDALDRGIEVGDLSAGDLRTRSELFGDDVGPLLTPSGSVGCKRTAGSTAPHLVAEAIRRARGELAGEGEKP
jgi:argininosuccinate lyase